MRLLLGALLAVCCFAGCGGDDDGPSGAAGGATQATGTEQVRPSQQQQPGDAVPPSVRPARACLMRAGYTVAVVQPRADDASAPDYQMVASARGGAAAIAVYEQLARAKRYEAQIRRTAKRSGADVERRGRVTIVWVRLPAPADRARVGGCVF